MTEKHNGLYVDNNGYIIGSKGSWDFGSAGYTTGSVETWIKNKLDAVLKLILIS